MWIDREMAKPGRIERASHSGLVPPPPDWAMEYTQLEPAPNQGECDDLLLPGLFLRNSSFQTTLNMSGCGEHERHIFVFLSNMQGEGRLNGKPLPEGLTAVCGAHPFEAVLPPTDMLGMTITRDMLNGYLESVEGLVSPIWMGDGIHTFGDRKATSRATRMMRTLFARHFDDPSALMDSEAKKSLVSSIMDIIVSIPVGGDSSAQIDYEWSKRYQVVRRAREYIIDRIDEPLQIRTICRDIGVSRRALQYSFQDALGINPIAFVRIFRLNRARCDLTRTGAHLQVKDVIDRWGFWHPSRFSGEYRQMFDELPSETLRRCRPIE